MPIEPEDLGLPIIAPDGSTALKVGLTNNDLLRYDHLNASATVGLTILDGKRTLGIAFEGTNDPSTDNGKKDLEQDLLFIKGYYDSLNILTSAVKTYIENHGDIDQVLVTGHSLGGAAAQSFMHEFGQNDNRYVGVTFGSPGTNPSESVPDERFVNIQHNGDNVVIAARNASKNIINGSIINVDVEDSGVDGLLREHTLYTPLDNSKVSYRQTVEFITSQLDANSLFRDMSIVAGTNGNDNLGARVGRDGEVLLGGNGDDTMKDGIGGLDTQIFKGGLGNDNIDGDGGVDYSVYTGARSNYSLQHNNLSDQLIVTDQRTGSDNDGTDTLNSIERIIFTDSALALDMDESAGIVAKLIGAVFGAESVSNANFVGIGLSELDKGTSYEDLAALAIGAAGANSPEQTVALLWNNVVGSPASTEQAQPFIDMLNNDTSTGELGMLAAETSINQANIDLVGLKESGIVYNPLDFFS